MATKECHESSQLHSLHVIFFPLMAHGHMIPLFDIARLFASRGVKATLVTTPGNAATFSESGTVDLKIIRFPSEEVGLAAGLENLSQITGTAEMNRFIEALKMIAEGPLKELLVERRPSCLVADFFLPWTADVASTAGVPWVVFNGGGYFATAVSDAIRRHRVVEGAEEEFVVTGVPGGVRIRRRELAPVWTEEAAEENRPFREVLERAFEAVEERCFGAIFNTFYEMEADYAEYYKKLIGKKCWSLGPVSLCYRNMEDKAIRGKQASIDANECLKWLDSKPANSVIYVCFGSIAHISSAQLTEIGMALEASGHPFIWVVNKVNNNDDDDNNNKQWLPSGFEARNKGKGLIIRGWAPQVMILDHVATGGFVTHCGWNSTMEAVSGGVTMLTWPIFGEQFMNEKLITEVLRVGVSVGVANRNSDWTAAEATVGREDLVAAVRRVMGGEEMRRRALELKELAHKAVQKGGSSYNGLNDILKSLSC